MALFRTEAIEAQRRGRLGRVSIHQPVSLGVLTVTCIALSLLALGFALSAAFAKKETVTGRLVPRDGLAELTAVQPGTVTVIYARVGQTVSAGAPILRVASGADGPGGRLSEREHPQILAKIAEIDLQLTEAKNRSGIEIERFNARADTLAAQSASLREILTLQQRQLALSRGQLDRIAPLVEKGFISGLERDRRLQAVLAQEQSVSDVSRQIESNLAEAADARAQARQSARQAEAEASQLRTSRASLQQSLIEVEAEGVAIIRAPFSGDIASLNIRRGDFLPAGFVVASVAAPGAMQAQLLIPTASAGFIKIGMPVRLMVDAFPFQRFGALKGKVIEIARAPVSVPSAQGASASMYRVIVNLEPGSHLTAYGRAADLRPGMGVTADLLIGKATIANYLLDPILSARARQGDIK